jgi:mevalonate kinase
VVLSIPGKTFLIGEYAVLAGLPAIVAAVPCRFELRRAATSTVFHPESPAGKLASPYEFPYEFYDPLQGSGGFGASTAQFALVYRALGPELGWNQNWEAVWARYREQNPNSSGLPPSGADLAAQWLGGIIRFQIERGEPTQQSVSAQLDWSALMIFSASHQAGRKTATHHHLGALHPKEFPEMVSRLRLPLEAGLRAVEHGDLVSFGQAMELYADELRGAGLEVDATSADRRALGKLPGVLGVKGTGAHQSDAVIVLADSDPAHRAGIIEAARARDLRPITIELTVERGIG